MFSLKDRMECCYVFHFGCSTCPSVVRWANAHVHFVFNSFSLCFFNCPIKSFLTSSSLQNRLRYSRERTLQSCESHFNFDNFSSLQRLNFQRAVATRSPMFEYMILALVILYVLVVFILIIIDDPTLSAFSAKSCTDEAAPPFDNKCWNVEFGELDYGFQKRC